MRASRSIVLIFGLCCTVPMCALGFCLIFPLITLMLLVILVVSASVRLAANDREQTKRRIVYVVSIVCVSVWQCDLFIHADRVWDWDKSDSLPKRTHLHTFIIWFCLNFSRSTITHASHICWLMCVHNIFH